MSFDPSKMNAKTAISKIKRLRDPADLESAKAAEEAGSSRKTVLAAIAETLVKITAEAAAAAVPEKVVSAPPNEGTVGLVTKVFHGRNVIIK